MNKYFFQILIISCCLVAISLEATAQTSTDIQNLENLNVDALTDEQIQKLIDQLESSGYSEQQLEVLARARGMSSTQIAKLRQRIQEVQSGTSKSRSGTTGSQSRSRISPELDYNRKSNREERTTTFDPFSSIFPEDTLAEVDELEIFGMSFFEDSNLSFDPSLNVATPTGYIVGPGDEIIIDVYGASEQTYQLEVSPDGYIVIPNIGPIYVNGLAVEDAESRIKSKLRSIYSTLGSNTFAQISLGQIHTISVNVVGEVKHPGTYEISSFGTAFNALYLAGGPSEKGSLRDIQVFRGGKQVGILDAYDFLVFGEGKNILLQDQDVLLVKPYHHRVALKGEVKRPAYYETRDQETLEQAISFAGGFNSSAYTKSISIRRNLENRKTVQTVDKSFFSDFTLKDGDEVDVGRIQNQFVNRIRIEGAVNHPGEFELKEGMTLNEALLQADGLRGDAFLMRGVIIRQNDDLSLSSLAFNPRTIVSGEENLNLKSEDLIKIMSIFDLREDYTISIEGEVLSPGEYPYADDMTVEDLIYLAKGFKETAAKSFVEVARRVTDERGGEGDYSAEIYNFPISSDLSLSSDASTFLLEPFDLVVIRKSPFYEKQEIVEVEGEVQYPGKYALEAKNERISDVLQRAGGVTKYGYIKGATLIRRTEYYLDEEDSLSETNTAAKIRREELLSLFTRDTLMDAGAEVNQKSTASELEATFKTQESIGIQLDQILANPGSKYDLILKRGDVISIPRELQTVRIRGEVLYPSTVRYDDTNSFKDFISQAGGFTDRAIEKRAYVVYANGSAERTKKFLWFKDYPKVEPGAEIIIPRKEQRERLSPQAWISLSSGVATLSLVILRILDEL